MNQPQQLPQKPHVCFSGDITCSGCVPCARCQLYVRTYVLPPAMAAAGFAGSHDQSLAFFQTYKDVGWPRFHQMMVNDPGTGPLPFTNQFKVSDVMGMIAELEMHRARERATQAGMAGEDLTPASELATLPPDNAEPTQSTFNAAPEPLPLPPLTVEEVVASTRKVILGDVMQVPPELQHHVNGAGAPWNKG